MSPKRFFFNCWWNLSLKCHKSIILWIEGEEQVYGLWLSKFSSFLPLYFNLFIQLIDIWIYWYIYIQEIIQFKSVFSDMYVRIYLYICISTVTWFVNAEIVCLRLYEYCILLTGKLEKTGADTYFNPRFLKAELWRCLLWWMVLKNILKNEIVLLNSIFIVLFCLKY